MARPCARGRSNARAPGRPCSRSIYRPPAGSRPPTTAGLVHRDFKPDNVLVGRDGRVRVADFGLARAHHDTVSSADISSDTSSSRPRRPELAVLTRTDAVLGTPAYMAPEQHGRGSVTPAVDQFAFGVALHEALWGQRPFGDMPNWLASDADLVTPPTCAAHRDGCDASSVTCSRSIRARDCPTWTPWSRPWSAACVAPVDGAGSSAASRWSASPPRSASAWA
ncbi:MAG: protein kinase [Deltaproteobacteria bacterium]|nr:protein kinase [Deltaproteobacteria bacterium]